ncbi:MAG: hypothetical protein NT129_00290 [Candidatus Aenigmarchaeota archaeon]|nr:hypothetical protein [Candidatus Aenigmarchaeota archaeon]
MKAYHKQREDNGMHIMLLLERNLDCMVVYKNGFFDFGLWSIEATGHETIKKIAETGIVDGTKYRELQVDDKLADETTRIGTDYRIELNRLGIRPIYTELRSVEEKHHLLNSPVPKELKEFQDFQVLARELYESAGIKL